MQLELKSNLHMMKNISKNRSPFLIASKHNTMNSELHSDFIQNIQNVLSLLEKNVFLVNFILACVSLIVNLFHLSIITQKSMRTSSINVLMISMTICDTFSMLNTIYRYLELVDLEYPECIASDSFIKAYMDGVSWSFLDFFKRCSCWLGIFIATVRLIIIRNVSDTSSSNATTPKLGIILILSVIGINCVFQGMCQYAIKIVENHNNTLYSICAEHQDITKIPKFFYIFITNFFSIIQTYIFLDAILSHVIPSIAFSFLTVFLLREIRKFEESRLLLQKSGEDNEQQFGLPTRLITLLTTTSFVADAPLGCIAILKLFVPADTRQMRLLTDLVVYFNILSTAVIVLHRVMCLMMSSQYRITAQKLFRIKKRTMPSIENIIRVLPKPELPKTLIQ